MNNSDDDFMDSCRLHDLPPPSAIPGFFSGNKQGEQKSMVTHIEETETTSSYDTHSTDAKRFMGTFIPRNTLRGSRSSLFVLCKFVVGKDKFLSEQSIEAEYSDRQKLLADGRMILFPNGHGSILPCGYANWSSEQLRRVRFWLIEFVVQYRSLVTGKEVSPSTMKSHIMNIQRGFKILWKYDLKLLQGDIFADPNEGLLAVMDNKFRLQQSHGAYTVSHNVLTISDLEKLYKSRSLSRANPLGFLTRMVFNIALVTSMRPSSLVNLKMSQFDRRTVDGDIAWVITGVIGCSDGASKTERGGYGAVGDKPTTVSVWRETVFGGALNVFDDIDEYMWMRSQRNVGTDRFFLQSHSKAQHRRDFFKAQHVGKNSFMNLVKNACDAEGIVGTGARKWVTTHSLRATVASLLCRAKHPGSSVAMRTGHRAVEKSLKSYQNLMSDEGRQQQRDIFGHSFKSDTCENGNGVAAMEELNKENRMNDNDEIGRLQFKSVKREFGLSELSTVLGSVGNVHNSTINVSITFGGSGRDNLSSIENNPEK